MQKYWEIIAILKKKSSAPDLKLKKKKYTRTNFSTSKECSSIDPYLVLDSCIFCISVPSNGIQKPQAIFISKGLLNATIGVMLKEVNGIPLR